MAHQVTVDAGRGGPALGDRPHDQRLPAAHIAGHEHPGHRGLEVVGAGHIAAVGQVHAELAELGVELTDRGNVARSADFETSVPGVFVAGDMGRGQSLIVWAIAEGRAAAAGVDRHLMGHTALPAPIQPTAAPQR